MIRIRGFSHKLVSLITLLLLTSLPVGAVFAAANGTSLFATTRVVDTLDDTQFNDCLTGACTLREAINDAAAGDTITFSVTGTINLTRGQITVGKSLTIEGPAGGITVNGSGTHRIFLVTGVPVIFRDITIQNGYSASDKSAAGGGAIYNSGTLTLDGVTLKGNTAAGNKNGSAIYNTSVLTLENMTASGNTTSDQRCATIYNHPDAQLSLVNSTITANTNTSGSAIVTDSPVNLRNTIIGGNTGTSGAADCRTWGGVSLISGGYNLVQQGVTDSCLYTPAATDITGIAPGLGSLQNNGGPTYTHLPLSGSPVIDTIPQGTDACNNAPADDQRGVARPTGAGCEIGSVELPVPTLTLATSVHTSYTENDPPVIIDDQALVVDPVKPNFENGYLSVELTANGDAGDRLSVQAGGNITLGGPDNSQVFRSAVLIGSLTGGEYPEPLVIILNASATPAITQELVRQLAFDSLSENPSAEMRTVEVTLADGDGGVSMPGVKYIEVTPVNDAPTLSDIDDQEGDELTLISFTAETDDVDLPDDELTYSLTAPGGTSGAQVDQYTGEFTWTPSEAQGPGEYEFTIRVTDSGEPALWAEKSFKVEVNEVNEAPVLTPVSKITVDEGTEAAFTAEAEDPDFPANTIALSLEDAPTDATFDTGTGAFSWMTGEEDGPGVFTFTLTATDNGVPVLSDSQVITIEVKEVNVAPAFGTISDQEIEEGDSVSLPVTATDADIPANTLTYDLVEGPDGAVVNSSTGLFEWEAGESDGGETYEVIVHVVDDGVPAQEDVVSFDITVAETNQAPEISLSDTEKTVLEGQQVTVTASATDADVPANTLQFSLDAGAPDGAGIDPSTGVFTWTPDEDQARSEAYTIVIRVTDEGSPVKSDTAELTIWVTEGNLPPVLDPIGDKEVMVNNLLTFTATGSDPDVPAPVLTFSIGTSDATGAVIDPDTGVFTWTPTKSGVYSVEIIISDGEMSDSETFQITVNLYYLFLPLILR